MYNLLNLLQEKRRLYHTRNVKVNKIKEIIERQNANRTPSRRAPQAPQRNSSPQPPDRTSMDYAMTNSATPTGPPQYGSNIPYRYFNFIKIHSEKII